MHIVQAVQFQNVEMIPLYLLNFLFNVFIALVEQPVSYFSNVQESEIKELLKLHAGGLRFEND